MPQKPTMLNVSLWRGFMNLVIIPMLPVYIGQFQMELEQNEKLVQKDSGTYPSMAKDDLEEASRLEGRKSPLSSYQECWTTKTTMQCGYFTQTLNTEKVFENSKKTTADKEEDTDVGRDVFQI